MLAGGVTSCHADPSRRLAVGFGAGLTAAAAAGQLLLCLWECSGSGCTEVSAFVLLRGVYLCGSCLLSWVRLHLRCYQQTQEQPGPEPGCVGTSRPPCRGRRALSHPSHANGHWPGPSPRARDGDGACRAPVVTVPPGPPWQHHSRTPQRRGAQAAGMAVYQGQPHSCSTAVHFAAAAAVRREGGGSRAVGALLGLISWWVLCPKHRGDRSPPAVPAAPIPPSLLGCPIPTHPPLPSSSGRTPPAVSTNPNH